MHPAASQPRRARRIPSFPPSRVPRQRTKALRCLRIHLRPSALPQIAVENALGKTRGLLRKGTLRRGKGCGVGRTYIVGWPSISASFITPLVRLVQLVDLRLHLLKNLLRSIKQINNFLPIPRIDVAVGIVVLFVGRDSSVSLIGVVVRRGIDPDGTTVLGRLLGIIELIELLSVGGRGGVGSGLPSTVWSAWGLVFSVCQSGEEIPNDRTGAPRSTRTRHGCRIRAEEFSEEHEQRDGWLHRVQG